uniref:DNA repair helicase rad3 n=1 Tax=Philasterides dicentrarchi TaxID=282688 RepID=A0A481XV21_9CILI|nr:DNA repair helicase rad3 [Philasterides dicentrarchi]
MMAVNRGKLSEGYDFPDGLCRAVFMVGIPFPPLMDIKVNQKKKHLDAMKERGGGKISGQDWYLQQTMRATNQAIGRVVRHKNDFGAIYLTDLRFERYDIKGQISGWIRDYLKVWRSFADVDQDTARFFKLHMQSQQQVNQPTTLNEILAKANQSNDDLNLQDQQIKKQFNQKNERKEGRGEGGESFEDQLLNKIQLNNCNYNVIGTGNSFINSNKVSNNCKQQNKLLKVQEEYQNKQQQLSYQPNLFQKQQLRMQKLTQELQEQQKQEQQKEAQFMAQKQLFDSETENIISSQIQQEQIKQQQETQKRTSSSNSKIGAMIQGSRKKKSVQEIQEKQQYFLIQQESKLKQKIQQQQQQLHQQQLKNSENLKEFEEVEDNNSKSQMQIERQPESNDLDDDILKQDEEEQFNEEEEEDKFAERYSNLFKKQNESSQKLKNIKSKTLQTVKSQSNNTCKKEVEIGKSEDELEEEYYQIQKMIKDITEKTTDKKKIRLLNPQNMLQQQQQQIDNNRNRKTEKIVRKQSHSPPPINDKCKKPENKFLSRLEANDIFDSQNEGLFQLGSNLKNLTGNDGNSNSSRLQQDSSMNSQQLAEAGHKKCCICWEYKEQLYESSHCHHQACYPCWENWLQNKLECPMCREKVRLKYLQLPQKSQNNFSAYKNQIKHQQQ